jgi:predicted transcriptional regulator
MKEPDLAMEMLCSLCKAPYTADAADLAHDLDIDEQGVTDLARELVANGYGVIDYGAAYCVRTDDWERSRLEAEKYWDYMYV